MSRAVVVVVHWVLGIIFMKSCFFICCVSEGSHTLSKTVVISTGKAAGMLSRFTTKKATCVGCRVPIKGKYNMCSSTLSLYQFRVLDN